MGVFRLTEVEPEPRVWEGEYGRFHIFSVGFDGPQGKGRAEIKQKDSTPAPTVGQTVDAEIVHRREGLPPELKRVRQGFQGATGQARGRSPEERAEMRRMSAQKQAIDLLRMELETGLIEKEKLAGVKASELLIPRIQFFYDDIARAGK